jgi:hypothetical protein
LFVLVLLLVRETLACPKLTDGILLASARSQFLWGQKTQLNELNTCHFEQEHEHEQEQERGEAYFRDSL